MRKSWEAPTNILLYDGFLFIFSIPLSNILFFWGGVDPIFGQILLSYPNDLWRRLPSRHHGLTSTSRHGRMTWVIRGVMSAPDETKLYGLLIRGYSSNSHFI